MEYDEGGCFVKIHIVRQGETLVSLAQKYNTPIDRLLEANPHLNENDELKPGSKVRVPTGKIPLASVQREPKVSLPESVQEEMPKVPSVDPSLLEIDEEEVHIPEPPYVTDLEEFLGKIDSSSPLDSSFFHAAEVDQWESGTYPPYVAAAPWEMGAWPYPYYPIPSPMNFSAPYRTMAVPAFYPYSPMVPPPNFVDGAKGEPMEQMEFPAWLTQAEQWTEESSSSEW